MNIFKECWTLISAIFKNTPDTPLQHIEMEHILWKGYAALTWAGLLVTRPGYYLSKRTINHEDIHRQQAQTLGSYWKFYAKYLGEYLGNLFVLWSFDGAYHCISFEMEAYGNEGDYNYAVTKESMAKYKIKNKRRVWKENRQNWKLYCRSI